MHRALSALPGSSKQDMECCFVVMGVVCVASVLVRSPANGRLPEMNTKKIKNPQKLPGHFFDMFVRLEAQVSGSFRSPAHG